MRYPLGSSHPIHITVGCGPYSSSLSSLVEPYTTTCSAATLYVVPTFGVFPLSVFFPTIVSRLYVSPLLHNAEASTRETCNGVQGSGKEADICCAAECCTCGDSTSVNSNCLINDLRESPPAFCTGKEAAGIACSLPAGKLGQKHEDDDNWQNFVLTLQHCWSKRPLIHTYLPSRHLCCMVAREHVLVHGDV